MKSFFSTFLLSIVLFQLKAQEPIYTWSAANTKPAMNVDVQIMGYTPEGYFVVSKKPASGMEFSPTITVEYFNDKQERIFVKNVTPTKQEDYVNILYYNKSLCLFSALYTKESGKNSLTATRINTDGTLGKPVEMGSLMADKLSNRGLFNVSVSPDGSKALVLSQPDYVKGENEKITISLFGDQFTKIWSVEKTYPYGWTKAVENRPAVNNQGTVFILKKTDMKSDGNAYSIFSFDGKELKEFKIAMDGNKKVASVVEAFAPNGDFTVGGYYNEDGKVRAGMGTALHGTFLSRIDQSGNAAKFAVITPFEKRKDIIAKSILFHDNTSILLGERYYISSQAPKTDPTKPPGSTDMFARDYTYYGEDIIIDGFGAAGKSLYYTSVEKENRSNNDNGTSVSYFAEIIKGKLVLIFMNDKDDFDEKKKVVVFGGTPKVIAHVGVDPVTGKAAAMKPILNTGDVGGKGGDMYLRPDVYLRTGETSYIIRAENTSIYRMGKLSF